LNITGDSCSGMHIIRNEDNTYIRTYNALGIWDVMTVFQGLIFGSTSEAQNSVVCPFKSCLLQVVHSHFNGCDPVQNWTAFVLWHFQFLSLCCSFWGINSDTLCQTANPVVGKQWNSWEFVYEMALLWHVGWYSLLLQHEFRPFGLFHKWPPHDITSWILIFCLRYEVQWTWRWLFNGKCCHVIW